MLNLAMLEQSLSVIGGIGKGEITFMVKGNIPVTLRTLTGKEVSEAREYSQEGSDENQIRDVVERYKLYLLSYSIVQVGSLDLRNVSTLETGEVLPSGVPVKVPKAQAVRKILETWSQGTTLALFQKYLELAYRVEADTDEAIQFDIADLDAEILRVENRLTKLKAERDRNAKDTTASQAQIVSDVDVVLQNETQSLNEVAVRAVPVVPKPPVAPVRERVLPPQPAPPPPVAPPVAVARPQTYEDVGSMSDDVEAENARLFAARAARYKVEEPEVIPVSINPTPPHRAALNLVDAVLDTGVTDITPVRNSAPRDPNMPVLDAATIIPRPAPDLNSVNTENTGSRNPRFRR